MPTGSKEHKQHRFVSGVIDPITIIGVLFLIVTLGVGTYVINDKKFDFNIFEKAGSCTNVCLQSDFPELCGCTSSNIEQAPAGSGGITKKQVEEDIEEYQQNQNNNNSQNKPKDQATGCNANGTTYKNGAIVVGGSDASGFSRCEKNKWVPCPTCTITQLTTVPAYLQEQYNQAVQNILTSQEIAEQTAPRPNNLPVKLSDSQQEQKNICLLDGGMWSNDSMSCNYQTYQQLQEQVQVIQNQRTRGEARCSGSTLETWNGSRWNQQHCPNGCTNGGCIAAIQSFVEVSRDENGTTRNLVTIIRDENNNVLTSTSNPIKQYSNIEKVEEGFIRSFTNIIRDGNTDQILNAITQNVNTSTTNNSLDLDCGKPGLTQEQRDQCTNIARVSAYNNPITGRYIQSFSNPNNIFQWQQLGYSSSEEAIQDCVDKNGVNSAYSCMKQMTGYGAEQVASSVQLGATGTAIGALTVATGGLVTGAISLPNAIALGMATSTMYQTGSAVDICIISPNSPECRNAKFWAGVSWLNIGSSWVANTYQASKVAQGINTAVNLANIGFDYIDIKQSCGDGQFASDFGCVAAWGGLIFDVGQGGVDIFRSIDDNFTGLGSNIGSLPDPNVANNIRIDYPISPVTTIHKTAGIEENLPNINQANLQSISAVPPNLQVSGINKIELTPQQITNLSVDEIENLDPVIAAQKAKRNSTSEIAEVLTAPTSSITNIPITQSSAGVFGRIANWLEKSPINLNGWGLFGSPATNPIASIPATTTPLTARIGDWVDRNIGNNPIINRIIGRPEDISLRPNEVTINTTEPRLPSENLAKGITGIEIGDAEMTPRLLDDHYSLKQKYNLPDRGLRFENPNEYINQLNKIAKDNGIPIRDASEWESFFQNHPAGAVFDDSGKQIFVDFRTAIDDPLTYSGLLEHELVHALQNRRYPGMPVEVMEYEAYITANMSLANVKSDPKNIQETIFNNIEFSVDHWYKEKGLQNPWLYADQKINIPPPLPSPGVWDGVKNWWEGLKQSDNKIVQLFINPKERGSLGVPLPQRGNTVTITLGRDFQPSLFGNQDNVSRQHGTITITQTGEIKYTDNSTNGTFYRNNPNEDFKSISKGQSITITPTTEIKLYDSQPIRISVNGQEIKVTDIQNSKTVTLGNIGSTVNSDTKTINPGLSKVIESYTKESTNIQKAIKIKNRGGKAAMIEANIELEKIANRYGYRVKYVDSETVSIISLGKTEKTVITHKNSSRISPDDKVIYVQVNPNTPNDKIAASFDDFLHEINTVALGGKLTTRELANVPVNDLIAATKGKLDLATIKKLYEDRDPIPTTYIMDDLIDGRLDIRLFDTENKIQFNSSGQSGQVFRPLLMAATVPIIGFYYADQYFDWGIIDSIKNALSDNSIAQSLGVALNSGNFPILEPLAPILPLPANNFQNINYVPDIDINPSQITIDTPPADLTVNSANEGSKCQRIDRSNPCDGKRIYELYLWYKNQDSAWWNEDGDFTPADFLALMLLAEAKGSDPDFLRSIMVATSNQLWGEGNPAAPNGVSYCTTPNCESGIFNFIGAYMEAGSRRYNELLYSGVSNEEALNILNSDYENYIIFKESGLTIDEIANNTIYNPISSIYSNDVPTQWGNFGCGAECDYLGNNWLEGAIEVPQGTTNRCSVYDVVSQDNSQAVVFTNNQAYNWSLPDSPCKGSSN